MKKNCTRSSRVSTATRTTNWTKKGWTPFAKRCSWTLANVNSCGRSWTVRTPTFLSNGFATLSFTWPKTVWKKSLIPETFLRVSTRFFFCFFSYTVFTWPSTNSWVGTYRFRFQRKNPSAYILIFRGIFGENFLSFGVIWPCFLHSFHSTLAPIYYYYYCILKDKPIILFYYQTLLLTCVHFMRTKPHINKPIVKE